MRLAHPIASIIAVVPLAACAEDAPPSEALPDLQLACDPAPGPLHVGDPITITATFDAGGGPLATTPPLDWTEVSGGGGVSLEATPGGWHRLEANGSAFTRTVHATALRPGRTTLMTRWTDPETPAPAVVPNRNTACTYDIVDAPPTQPTLTVGVTHVGVVTSTPAGITCTQPSFGPEAMVCSATLAPGSVMLAAAPDAAFGYVATKWTGCDVIEGSRCLLELTASRRVDACFHDGSPAGLAGCP